MKALFESGKIKVKTGKSSSGVGEQSNYTYFIKEDLMVEMIIFSEKNPIAVFKYTKENKSSEDNKVKYFKNDFKGFEEATDYFESLIREEDEKGGGGGNGGNEPMPPIGILTMGVGDSCDISMQDGRKAVKPKSEIVIENGVLHISINEGAEKEKFFVQKTKKENVFALYPVSDGTPPDDNVENGHDLEPSEPKKPSEPKEPEEPKEPQENTNKKNLLAKYLGFNSFDVAMKFFPKGKESMILLLDNYSEPELVQIASNLELEQKNKQGIINLINS